jgi:hypothetical protein
MTRTVEHLQVNKEDEDGDEDENEHNIAEFLIQKIAFLEPPKDWIQKEERRRVFWNVFLMDRFLQHCNGLGSVSSEPQYSSTATLSWPSLAEGNPVESTDPIFWCDRYSHARNIASKHHARQSE